MLRIWGGKKYKQQTKNNVQDMGPEIPPPQKYKFPPPKKCIKKWVPRLPARAGSPGRGQPPRKKRKGVMSIGTRATCYEGCTVHHEPQGSV